MCRIQSFINWQAAAIKTADPAALVTVGTWSQYSQTDAFSNTSLLHTAQFIYKKSIAESLMLHFKLQGNYYMDACLVAAGGKTLGKLDFYQIHTYAPFRLSAPYKVNVYITRHNSVV